MYGFGFYATLSLIVPILVLAGIVFSKMRSNRRMPAQDHAPFDLITGQAPAEFSAEIQERGEDTEKRAGNQPAGRSEKGR